MIHVPLNANIIGSEEIRAAKAVLDSGRLTMGQRCREFETAFSKYVGVKHALFVNSGSSANLMAAFALANPLCPLKEKLRAIVPGSEVIMPALTWSTTVWPFVQAGAIPIFVDCDPHTLQMIPGDIEAAITERTVAIAVVHVLGGAVDVSSVRKIADQHHLWLFEDSCESLGVLWEGHQVGSFGHLASYSFYFAHHITTIEGGMVVTDDDELADLMRAIRAHGWIRHMEGREFYRKKYPELDPRFLFITSGFNLRPTEINAAIGLVQLKQLDEFNHRRRNIAGLLSHGLESICAAGALSSMTFDPRCTPAPFGYPVLCRSSAERNGLQNHLEKNGIETRPIICGNLTRQPALTHIQHGISGSLSGADRVMDCGLYWGTHPMMTSDEIKYIVSAIEGFYS